MSWSQIEQLRADLATLEAAKKVDLTPATLHRLNQEIDYIEIHIAELEAQQKKVDPKAISAEKNREKLAELTTILNAIPPACGLARELVEKRIESVKKELQSNE